MESNFKIEHHYVPQFYLKHWSLDGQKVYVYRKLVSHKCVPLWSPQYIRSVGKLSHLYTLFAAGKESDEVENWFNEEFETPVQEAYNRAISNKVLSRDDWIKLVRYLAAQAMRTPANLMMHQQFLESKLKEYEKKPFTIDHRITKEIERLGFIRYQQLHKNTSKNDLDDFIGNFKTDALAENDNSDHIKVAVSVDHKGAWIATLRRLLNKRIDVLLKHRWTILEIDPSVSLVTSDDPVVFLNFIDRTHYDFKGGWRSKNTDIIMPLDPHHALYTQVSHSQGKRSKFNLQLSELLQEVISKHAFRYIFSTHENTNIAHICPREVDSNKFISEKNAWSEIHR